MKKLILGLFVLFTIAMPMAFADEGNQTSSCGIFNMMQCLHDTAYLITYSTGLAAEPFLNTTATIMTLPAYTTPFQNTWLAITGLISAFYIFFLMYSGITFITQGDNLSKRYEAKETIKHMIIAIILVASSFYIYGLLTDFNASLTSYIFSQVDPSFFSVTSTSIGNAIFQILLIIPYVFLIMLTLDLLCLRWILVSLGVILFPIGIFFYFVPFLRSYGKLIINLLVMLIFIPFFISIIILGASTLVTTPIFSSLSILFMTVSFLLIDFVFYLLIKFAMSKAAGNEAINYGKLMYGFGKNMFNK